MTSPSPAPNLRAVALLALAGGLALVLGFDLAGRDPSSAASMRWYPKCALFALLRVRCPGCGATRAAHALLHGDLGAALRANALFVLAALPAGLYAYASAWRRAIRGRGLPDGAPRARATATFLGFALLLAFFVARNVPAEPFSWLAAH